MDYILSMKVEQACSDLFKYPKSYFWRKFGYLLL